MKKLLFIILISFLFIKCTENEQNVKTENLKLQLNQIALNKSQDLKTDPLNCNNPYDFAGEMYQEALDKIINDESKTKSVYNGEESFKELLQKELGDELNLVNYDHVDANKVELLFKEFARMYLNQDPEYFFSISAEMEDCVYNSTEINDDEKIVLLQLASVVKFYLHYSRQIHQTNTKSYSDSLDSCFRRKMEELYGQEGAYFDKLLCVADWPLCLGAKFFDCIVEISFNDSNDEIVEEINEG